MRRLRRAFDSGTSLKSLERQDAATAGYQPICWRDLKSILQDPDSAKGPRLELMTEAGFAMAAGVCFETHSMHHQGIVVYYTSTVDEADERLANETITRNAYLAQSAQLIGATMSLSEIRRASLADRHKLKEKCFSMNGRPANQPISEEDTKSHRASFCRVPNKLKGGMQIPPPMSWRQSLWTTVGSFVGLLFISALNQYLRFLSNEEYHLLLGPFGAMCTLMYGLTAAPASQPRNAVLGQIVAGAISLPFAYIPEQYLPIWLRIAVAPAFAIGGMVKLGIIHPPAGACSVLYASGRYNWAFYALVVMTTALSIIPATLVNNLSRKRQYPTYWGLWPGSLQSKALSWLCHRFSSTGSVKQEAESRSHANDTVPEQEADSSHNENAVSPSSSRSVRPGPVVIHEEDEHENDDEESGGMASQ